MVDILAAEAAEIAELEKQVSTATPSAPQAAPEPQPDPEEVLTDEKPGGEAEPQEQRKANPGQLVRRRDYIEAEKRREAAETRAREIEARYAQDMAKINERLASAFTQPKAEAKQQAPQIEVPDINQDPIGHFQAQLAIRDAKLAEVERWRNEQQQVSRQTNELQSLARTVSQQEAQFAATTPDYPDAQQFLTERWDTMGAMMGASPEEARRFFAIRIAQTAQQTNRNPGEIAYELAKKLGYAGKAQAAPQAQPQPQRQGPDMATLQRGVAVSKSTSVAPGTAAPGQLTAEAIRDMDEDEFMKRFAARDSKEWERFMRKQMNGASL